MIRSPFSASGPREAHVRWLHPCSAGQLFFLGTSHPGRGLLPSEHVADEPSSDDLAGQLC